MTLAAPPGETHEVEVTDAELAKVLQILEGGPSCWLHATMASGESVALNLAHVVRLEGGIPLVPASTPAQGDD